MDDPRYICMVEVHGSPLPPEFSRRYHYFRRLKEAQQFTEAIERGYTIHVKADGCSLMRPVAFPIFEYRGILYEPRVEFNYESLRPIVESAFVDHNIFGCDCGRSDILLHCQDYHDNTAGRKLECGEEIELVNLYVDFQTEFTDIELH